MRKLLLAGLALALSLVPIQGMSDHRQLATAAVVSAERCTAKVITGDDHDATESYYQPITHTLYIGTSEAGSPMIGLLILLHEIGHCQQYQEMTIPLQIALYPTTASKELDADMRSGRMACDMGIDGHTEIRKLFAWAKDTFGYTGDDNHGSAAERIAAFDAGCDSAKHKTPDIQGA